MLSLPNESVLGKARWLLLGALAAAALSHACFYSRLPKRPAPAPLAAAAFDWPHGNNPPAETWAVFRRLQGAAPASTGPLAKRFRLAGTFFAFGEPSAPEGNYCKAILDDALKKEQYLVREGDAFEGIQVVRIYQDRVVLRNQGVEEELWLSFANALAERPAAGPGAARRAAPADETPALEVNRFGKRVGENRWVLSRESLKGYYREMLDDPERLALLYVSMKPLYKEGAIAGYTMDMEGERDFFTSAGLRNGDVIRKVNSMNMTSQRRAEHFIGEFAKDRLNAVVLDIDRDNQPKKLIYMIR